MKLKKGILKINLRIFGMYLLDMFLKKEKGKPPKKDSLFWGEGKGICGLGWVIGVKERKENMNY